MIVQLRIDERLIHGQIVTSWSKTLNVNMIVVANDSAADNELQKAMLKMAAPEGIKVNIRKVDDCIRLLKDEKADQFRILLIVDNPQDALRLVNELPISDVNVANFTKKKAESKHQITTFISASNEDLELFRQLVLTGKNVYSQMLPSTEAKSFKDLIERL